MRYSAKQTSFEECGHIGVGVTDMETPSLLDSSNTPEALELVNREDYAKVEDSFRETGEVGQAALELFDIAAQLENIISTEGKLSHVEKALLTLSLNKVEKDSGESLNIPSLEDSSNSFSASQASMEGVIFKAWSNFLNWFGNSMQRTILTTVHFFKSFTPLIAKRKKRAEEMLSRVNNSNREAGLKEVSGAWVNKLRIDGKVPEAKSVLDNLKYLNEISDVFLGYNADYDLHNCLQVAIEEMTKDIKADKVEKPSNWWWIASILFAVAAANSKSNTGYHANKAGSDAAALGMDLRAMFLAMKSMPLNNNTMPQLFNIYKPMAKTKISDNDERIETYRSEFLLGNVYFKVSQLAWGQKFKDKSKILTKFVWDINGHGLGVVLRKGDRSYSDNQTIQALTSDQQREVLQQVIRQLDFCIEFYNDYGARITRRYEVWRASFGKVKNIFGDEFMLNPSKVSAHNALVNILNLITEMYWRGVYGTQIDYIKYLNTTAEALTTYAYESMRNSQADN